MYLPTSEPTERARITQEFTRYKQLCMDQLWGAYGACEHWAKVRRALTSRSLTRFRLPPSTLPTLPSPAATCHLAGIRPNAPPHLRQSVARRLVVHLVARRGVRVRVAQPA
jgi:hypothetical protein